MRKIYIPILSAFISLITSGQRSIDGLVQAENAFAAYSLAHGTKDAFLKFVDSSGVVFNEGKPVNGIDFWNKKAKDPGILNWHPQYAAIALSGDLGFTTGPWTFQKTLQDSIIARGVYTTVWHVNKNGEWKFLVDLGVSNSPANTDSLLVVLRNMDHTQKYSLSSLLKTEKKFIELSKDPAKAYKKYLSTDAILNRNGELPQYTAWKSNSFPQNIEYKILGSGIASSGDLGYVYGTTVINNKTNNYLRIWRQENREWRIVDEVLRY
jgi:ketosteroid isomerase-like protein